MARSEAKVESVFATRLKEAKDKKEFLKLVFQYPASNRAIVKRGNVIEVFDDGFDFSELFDGRVSYSFKYIVEITKEKHNG